MVPSRPDPLSRGAGRFTLGARLRRSLVTAAPAMPTYYYGTIPVLAWILNHYFYGGVHYAWLAESFLPPPVNPRSSNPHNIYGELMDAWRHRDPFNQYVRGGREALEKGVAAKVDARRVDGIVGDRLRAICANVSVELFFPVVYRVDVDQIGPDRQRVANSGLDGSLEVLIPDLTEQEFDLLFADNRVDPLFRLLLVDEVSGVRRTLPSWVLNMLEERCPR